jgi:hypothetical protein
VRVEHAVATGGKYFWSEILIRRFVCGFTKTSAKQLKSVPPEK